jgi:HEAT repeat protein
MHTQTKIAGLALAVIAGLVFAGPSRAKEPDGEAIKMLVAQLGSEDFQERQEAQRKLLDLGLDALPRLREAMRSGDPEVARRAAKCVEEIERVCIKEFLEKELGLKELPDLVRASQDQRTHYRMSAAYLLWKFHDKGRDAVPTLLTLLKDESALVRRKAASSLAHYVEYDDVVRALIAAMKDEDVEEREGGLNVAQTAALSLDWMQHPTREVVDALIEATKTGDDGLRYSALGSLGYLGPRNRDLTPEVIAALIDVLKGKDFVKKKRDIGLRAKAAAALGRIGADAKVAVPELLNALRAEGAADAETTFVIRLNVIDALGAIGPGAAAARPRLEDIVRSKDTSDLERREAIKALKKIIKE